MQINSMSGVITQAFGVFSIIKENIVQWIVTKKLYKKIMVITDGQFLTNDVWEREKNKFNVRFLCLEVHYIAS